MYTTSHYPMRTRTVTRREDGGCIRHRRPGRQVMRRQAIVEQTGIR